MFPPRVSSPCFLPVFPPRVSSPCFLPVFPNLFCFFSVIQFFLPRFLPPFPLRVSSPRFQTFFVFFRLANFSLPAFPPRVPNLFLFFLRFILVGYCSILRSFVQMLGSAEFNLFRNDASCSCTSSTSFQREIDFNGISEDKSESFFQTHPLFN